MRELIILLQLANIFYGPLVEAAMLKRLHRFAAEVETAGGQEVVHIPNSGRLKELLFAGNQVKLHFEGHDKRKTRHTLVAAHTAWGDSYVDSRLPNRILKAYWRDLPPLMDFSTATPEVSHGDSRFDLALQKEGQDTAFLEAKCVTLVRDGVGLFPDAPTERGRKHLQELITLRQRGRQAFVFFFVQHPAGVRLAANRETDPEFGKLLAEAGSAGVGLHAFRVEPGEKTIALTPLPVELA